MRSMLLFFIKFMLHAFPCLIIIWQLVSIASIFFFAICIVFGLISTPIQFLFNNADSTAVVPLPKNGSKIQSFSFVYLNIRFFGI